MAEDDYITMSLTWSETVPRYIDTLLNRDANPLLKQGAEGEIRRLATAMDKINEAIMTGKLVKGDKP